MGTILDDKSVVGNPNLCIFSASSLPLLDPFAVAVFIASNC